MVTNLRRYFEDSWAELKKVAWPTRETVINLTLIVIGVSVAVGAYIAVLDLLLQVLDQGAGRLHALSERGRLIPGILAHDRLSCVTRNSTLVERVTLARLGVKTLRSVHCLSGMEPPATRESQGLPKRPSNSYQEPFAEEVTYWGLPSRLQAKPTS